MDTPPRFSNYPRETGAMEYRGWGVQYAFIGDAIRMMARRPGVYLAGGAILVLTAVLPIVAMAIWLTSTKTPEQVDSTGGTESITGFMIVMALILQYFYTFCVGFAACAIEEADTGSTSLNTLFSPFRRFLTVGPTVLICQSAILVIGALFRPAGLLISAGLLFAPVSVLVDGIGPFTGIGRSMSAVSMHFVKFVGLVIVLSILMYASVLLLGIGVIAGIPLYYMVVGLHYREFRTKPAGAVYVPTASEDSTV